MFSLPRPELWAEPAKPGVLRFPPLRISMRIKGVQSLVRAFRSRNKIIVWKIDKYRYIGYNYKKCAGMAELADALVLGASLRVRVRPPLPAPRRRGLCIVRDDFSFYKSSLACTVAPPLRKKSHLLRLFACSHAHRAAKFLRDARTQGHQLKPQKYLFYSP